jgi:hypothetical protein
LWGLVSKWGLAELVEWDDVRSEIERLQRKAMTEIGYDQAMDQSLFHCEDHDDEHSLLLRQWASLLARLRGMHFENLSTNFADGRIYESIVDEYEGCILGSTGESDAGDRRQESLGLRLERLGCSSQFGKYMRIIPPTAELTANSTSRVPRRVWKEPYLGRRLYSRLAGLPLLSTALGLETCACSNVAAAGLASRSRTSRRTSAYGSQGNRQTLRGSRASQGRHRLGAGSDCEVVEAGEGGQRQNMRGSRLVQGRSVGKTRLHA